jgi:hypothetical protein
MACTRIAPNVIVCGPDGEGSATVNGKMWRWDFHNYLGPTFLKKNGDPLARQPGARNPVWEAFGEWVKQYDERRKSRSPE